MKHISKIIYVAMAALLLTSCKDFADDILGGAPDMEGETVSFTTDLNVPRSSTRAAFADKEAMNAELGCYKAINENYDLTVSMYKMGDNTPVATSKYAPTPVGSGFDSKGVLSLQAFDGNKRMYWPDNVNKYGFKATCGTTTVESDQRDWNKLIAQDALLGYAYGASYGNGADDIEAMNYHTNKEWYKMNKERLGNDAAAEDLQRIPLYLRHQRSWLTIILKAGSGVKREFLQKANRDKVVTTIFSYKDDSKVIIDKPLVSDATVHYAQADINGPAGDVQTTQYDAIVEPYDYSSNLETEICKIVVNDMKFTYYASDDEHANESGADLSAYNLTAGKHLTITAILSTDRVVHITALLEDWDEMTFNSICDDYGQNGDPIKIPDVETLKNFLGSADNKAGNTALISAAALTLPDDWEAKDLNASLNLAGVTITTKKQFLKNIGKNATVVNGAIYLTESADQVSALCTENHGTVQQVTVATDGASKVTKGAICDVNYGTIYNCTSYLAVQGDGTEDYVGGIAAESKYDASETTPSQPIIDKCTVNGRVGAESSEGVKGVGGIVGYAEGRLSNNTFNYGITIAYQGTDPADGENDSKYRNIVAATSTDGSKALGDRAYNNSWPTTIKNTLAGENVYASVKYKGVLDCQAELETLIKYGTSATGLSYRVAADFSVNNTWSYGQTEAANSEWTKEPTNPWYNHTFILDGNDHTITTHGKMLFSHINGEVKNLTIYCAESISEEPNETSTNVIAPLAYSVNGTNAKLTNVKVHMADDTYIQASQPSGLVCCAYGGAVIDGCEVQVVLKSKMKHDESSEKEGEGNDARRYMGGLAAFAVNAEFVNCKVHTGSTMAELLEPGLAKHTNLFRGGIVGGTTRKNEVDPSLLIHDCYSWCVSGDDSNNFGAIIGKTKFTKNNQDTNGMREGCQGNWWTSGYPAGDLGQSFDKILGKKNSVTPGPDNDWWK